jgi:hypothetical protein
MFQTPAGEHTQASPGNPDVLRQLERLRTINARLREQLERLRAENSLLREDNGELRRVLDAHLRRASSPALFGPLELTAGTCVGPRRQHRISGETISRVSLTGLPRDKHRGSSG